MDARAAHLPPVRPHPLDEAIAPWLRRATARIDTGFADVYAHARIGNFVTASMRLHEMQAAILGMIGDAREAFVRDAYQEPFDPELHDPTHQYSRPELVVAARSAQIGGFDHGKELRLLIDQAREGLTTTLAIGTVGRPDGLDPLRAWQHQHATAVRSWVRGRLSDDQMALTGAINALRRKPEFRDDDKQAADSI